jgi:hypothetical protein
MTTTELLALFRSEVFDLELPYLWSDELIYRYIDDAQKQFCRDTNGIADARSFKINVVAGTEWYKYDTKILKLRDAINQVTGLPMPIVSVEKMHENSMRFDGTLGTTRALISGLEENTLRTWPVPNEPMTIELRTFRLPEDVVAGDDLEIPTQHHQHLLHWVKHRAYSVQDTEAFDKGAADRYRALHDRYCAQARIEQNRVRRPVATVTYGGI